MIQSPVNALNLTKLLFRRGVGFKYETDPELASSFCVSKSSALKSPSLKYSPKVVRNSQYHVLPLAYTGKGQPVSSKSHGPPIKTQTGRWLFPWSLCELSRFDSLHSCISNRLDKGGRQIRVSLTQLCVEGMMSLILVVSAILQCPIHMSVKYLRTLLKQWQESLSIQIYGY